MRDPMLHLVVAAAFFFVLHVGLAGTKLRDRVIARIGEGPYLGLFSLLSVGGLVALALTYRRARGTADLALWSLTPGWRWVALVTVFIAAMFVFIGLTTKSPTTVGQGDAVDDPKVVRGIQTVTRHPFLWGVVIWGLTHLAIVGKLAGLVLFGTLALMCLLGTFSIDRKRARALGARWSAYAERTSNLPLAAIAGGRAKLRLREFGLWRPLLAVGLFVGLLLAHAWLFGVSPLPYELMR